MIAVGGYDRWSVTDPRLKPGSVTTLRGELGRALGHCNKASGGALLVAALRWADRIDTIAMAGSLLGLYVVFQVLEVRHADRVAKNCRASRRTTQRDVLRTASEPSAHRISPRRG